MSGDVRGPAVAVRTPVLVVGGGPAGYTAALYAARGNLAPVCVEGFESGGQLTRAAQVENFPGAAAATSGAELVARMREQAVAFGASMVLDDVAAIDTSRRPFAVTTVTGRSFLADAVIVTTGSRPRTLGLPAEESLIGKGLAYCALCDGAFFAGADVMVVGGGNAALGEALAMAHVAASVTVVHRRDTFRADAVVRQAVAAVPTIRVRTPLVVEDLVTGSDGSLCGVKLRDVATGSSEYQPVTGLFVAIGHEPATGLLHGQVAMRDGLIRTDGTATSVEGVFAAGDVVDARYRQAVTAAASGCQAAIDAERWLLSSSHLPTTPTTERTAHAAR